MPYNSFAFCTQADVTRRMSADGLLGHLDADGDGVLSAQEQLLVTDCIDDATSTCMYYCMHKYSATVLANNPWINRRAVDLACYAMFGVRGNPIPDSILARAEKAEKWLTEVREGQGLVPNAALLRRLAPSWANSRVDPRFQFRVIRVDPNTSSRPSPDYPQVIDYEAAFTFEL